MKTDRENRKRLKLIKLLSESPVGARKTLDDYLLPSTLGDIADYLISKGVTIPVRCGECKWGHPYERFDGTEGAECGRYGACRTADDFCSRGERKEDD